MGLAHPFESERKMDGPKSEGKYFFFLFLVFCVALVHFPPFWVSISFLGFALLFTHSSLVFTDR